MNYFYLIIAVAAVFMILKGRGGYKSMSQAKAKEMMDTQNVLVLDVREQAEYDSGHIAGARLLPVGTINAQSAAEIIPAKDAVVLVYCHSGNRSRKACAILARLGYTEVYEMGGITTWQYGVER